MALLRTINLGPKQQRYALCLAQHLGNWVPTAELVAAVYRNDPDPPITAEYCTKSMGSIIRRKLAPHGLRIDGQAFVGRRMTWD